MFHRAESDAVSRDLERKVRGASLEPIHDAVVHRRTEDGGPRFDLERFQRPGERYVSADPRTSLLDVEAALHYS